MEIIRADKLLELVKKSTLSELESMQALFQACLKERKKKESLEEILDVLKLMFKEHCFKREVLFVIRAGSSVEWLSRNKELLLDYMHEQMGKVSN